MGLRLENAVIIIDEAHNVDDACREAASLEVTRSDLLQVIASFRTMVVAEHLAVVSGLLSYTMMVEYRYDPRHPPSSLTSQMHEAFQRIFSAALLWCDAQASAQGWAAAAAGTAGLAHYGFERQASQPAAQEAAGARRGIADEGGVQWSGSDAVDLLAAWGVSHGSYLELYAFHEAIADFRKQQQQEAAEAALNRRASSEPVTMLSAKALNLAERLLVCAGFLLSPPVTRSSTAAATPKAVAPALGGGPNYASSAAVFGSAPLQSPAKPATRQPDSSEHYFLMLQRDDAVVAPAQGATLAYDDGPTARGEPREGTDQKPQFRLCLWCMSPSLAFRDVEAQARCVILTSGTLSPLDSFAAELGVAFPLQLSAPHVINVGRQLWAGVVAEAHWAQGVALLPDRAAAARSALSDAASTPPLLPVSWTVEPVRPHRPSVVINGAYRHSQGPEYLEAIGTALLTLAAVTPGGILVFFPSYRYDGVGRYAVRLARILCAHSLQPPRALCGALEAHQGRRGAFRGSPTAPRAVASRRLARKESRGRRGPPNTVCPTQG